MGRVIGIISIKGGVGKTTVSASLASDLVNKYKKKVLLVDANYSAPNLGLHMDIVEPEATIHDVLTNKARMKSAIHSRYGVDVIPGSYSYIGAINPLKLRDKLRTVKEEYDFVIIDSSPSLNEEILSTILSSDNLFVVTTPDWPTLSCSLRAAKLAKSRGRPIDGIIINKIRDPDYELSLKEIESALEIPVVARIPDDVSNVRAVHTRIPSTIYNARSKFSKELSKLTGALSGESKISFWKKLFPFNFKREEINRELLRDNLYNPVFEEKDEKE